MGGIVALNPKPYIAPMVVPYIPSLSQMDLQALKEHSRLPTLLVSGSGDSDAMDRSSLLVTQVQVSNN